jgi:hypothetical protein
MTIAVTCTCGMHLRAKPELAGKTVKCPSCGKQVVVSGTPAAGGPRQPPAVSSATPTRGGNRGLIVTAAALALVGGLAVVYFVWLRPPSVVPATITAAPNPVQGGSNKFGTGDGRPGDVYVSMNGEAEKLFAGQTAKGSQEANWIGRGEYYFRLYASQEHKALLASVKVTWSEP